MAKVKVDMTHEEAGLAIYALGGLSARQPETEDDALALATCVASAKAEMTQDEAGLALYALGALSARQPETEDDAVALASRIVSAKREARIQEDVAALTEGLDDPFMAAAIERGARMSAEAE